MLGAISRFPSLPLQNRYTQTEQGTRMRKRWKKSPLRRVCPKAVVEAAREASSSAKSSGFRVAIHFSGNPACFSLPPHGEHSVETNPSHRCS